MHGIVCSGICIERANVQLEGSCSNCAVFLNLSGCSSCLFVVFLTGEVSLIFDKILSCLIVRPRDSQSLGRTEKHEDACSRLKGNSKTVEAASSNKATRRHDPQTTVNSAIGHQPCPTAHKKPRKRQLQPFGLHTVPTLEVSPLSKLTRDLHDKTASFISLLHATFPKPVTLHSNLFGNFFSCLAHANPLFFFG